MMQKHMQKHKYTKSKDNPIYQKNYEDYKHYSPGGKIQLGLQKPPHSLIQLSLYLSYSISLTTSHPSTSNSPTRTQSLLERPENPLIASSSSLGNGQDPTGSSRINQSPHFVK